MSTTISIHPASQPHTPRYCRRPLEVVDEWTAASSPDPFDQLDGAIAVVRALSRRIRYAAERRDWPAVDRLSDHRRRASAEVDRLLTITERMLDV